MESRAERYRRLKNAIDENPGRKYCLRMMLHERSLHIFGGNFADLKQILNFIEDPDNIARVWAEDKRSEQKIYHREVVRHFHNFLSASMSLVEHTRVFMREEHVGQPIFESYYREVTKRFANDPMARFVQDLRNYFLHKGIPNSEMQLSFNGDPGKPPVSQVLLKVIELRKWNKWSKKSREYLDNVNADLSLREVIDAYYGEVESFYEWFRKEMDHVHNEELRIYENLCQEVAEFEKHSF